MKETRLRTVWSLTEQVATDIKKGVLFTRLAKWGSKQSACCKSQKIQVQTVELTQRWRERIDATKLPSALWACSTVEVPKHTTTDTQK